MIQTSATDLDLTLKSTFGSDLENLTALVTQMKMLKEKFPSGLVILSYIKVMEKNLGGWFYHILQCHKRLLKRKRGKNMSCIKYFAVVFYKRL